MLAALFVFLASCATTTLSVPDRQSDVMAIRATVPFTLNDVSCPSGACVFPRLSTYQVKLQSPAKAKHLLSQSCHRFENYQIKFPVTEWRYTPGFWIENMGSCVLMQTVIREDGSKRLAIADFKANETAPATSHCNGQREKTAGATLCQSKVGLVQSVWFDQPAEAYSAERCSTPIRDGDGSRWEYRISEGLCVYLFVLKDGTRHRLTSWGFTDAAIDP